MTARDEHTPARAGSAPGRPWRLPVVIVLAAIVLAGEVGRWVLVGLGGTRALDHLSSSLAMVVFAVVGALVVRRGEAVRYGWLLLAMAVVGTTNGLALQYTELAWVLRPEADWPLAMAAAWYQDWWMVQWLLGFLLLPALFPDGRPVTRGWGRAVRATVIGWVVYIPLFMVVQRPVSNFFEGNPLVEPPMNPTGILAVPGSLAVAEAVIAVPWVVLTLASAVVGVSSMVVRWRRSGERARRQINWVLYAFGLLAAAAVIRVGNTLLTESGIDLGLVPVVDLLMAVAIGALPVAIGLGVLQRGLYDLGRVVNRTLVYGLLTVGVIAVYVTVVAGAGALVPGASDRGLALAATGLVAVAFDPARRRMQGLVNRLMFGQRGDPYAVLSRVGDVMTAAGTPTETLQAVVDTVARSLKLPWVAVELDQRDGQVVRAEHGSADGLAAPASVALVHRDEQVGQLLAAPRSDNASLGLADRRLLADIAKQAGAVAATARLTADLQHSREQLVLAREEERRRIRRDLHDGLGPSLAAQTLALDAATDQVDRDPARARALLQSLKADTQELVADIRRLVHDLRPPALDELGLAGALVAHVAQIDGSGKMAMRIRAEPDPLPALSAAVEVAAWRITREAMTNVVRHAEASTCTVTLSVRERVLDIRVVDDGIGLPVVPRAGVGMHSMRDRADELGGTFTAADAPDGGTIVQATLPVATSIADDAVPTGDTEVARGH
ncbi:MAG: sensor histidine kinase [Egibacteraceae bacterium]